jgi:hypothetical protein
MVEVVVSLRQDKMSELRKKALAISIFQKWEIRYLAGSNGHYGYLE